MQLLVNPEDRKGGSTLMNTVDQKYDPQEEVFKSPEVGIAKQRNSGLRRSIFNSVRQRLPSLPKRSLA